MVVDEGWLFQAWWREFDDPVKARVADMAAYRRLLGDVLVAVPGVKETRTYAVMEEVKRDGPLPVRGARAG